MHFFSLVSALILGLAGCGSEALESENPSAPQLQSTVPASGAVDVAYGSLEVVLSFDQNVKFPLSSLSLVSVDGGAAVESVHAYGAEVKIKLNSLEPSTTYTLLVPEGTVYGYKGEPQPSAAEIRLSFTTVEKETDPAEIVPVDDNNIAWQMSRKLGLGWNMGNQMDAFYNDVASETVWGNKKATQQTFTKLKSYGFSSVRIPITWLGHIGPAPDYKLDSEWLERVAEIVSYAEQAGLNCIINTHHDEENNDGHWLSVKRALTSPAAKQEITDELVAIWIQIAERFKDKGEFLIFEPFNELQDGGWGWSAAFKSNPTAQTDILNEWNQAFVDAVRATGGNNATRWLGVIGYAASSTFTIKYLELPEDPAGRLMVGFHSYDPYAYCIGGNYSQWGHTRTKDLGVKELDEKALIDILAPYYEKFVSKGIPVYIGEFGCTNRSTEIERAFQRYYMEYFVKAAKTYGMPAFLWDNGVAQTENGEALGYVDHATGEFIGQGKTLVGVMTKAMYTTDSSYTLESVYENSAP